ncbi:MAG TPA: hypothetical protein VE782_11890, partial [Myxococcaceae bacterium]|nr:hypothetical protein [Myxococcaceae bacterium]
SQDARISEQARLGQNAERLPSERVRAGPAPFLFGWLRLSIGLFALGLLWRLLAPKLSRQAPATLRSEPWKSLGLGALALAVAPLAGALLFGLGLLLGGWWLAVLLFAALLVAVSLAFPTVGLLVGESLFGRFGKAHARLAATLAVGVLLLALLMRVPLVGAVILPAATLFGLGALLLASWHLRRASLPSTASG